MSIPPNAPWRGCASSFRGRMDENDVHQAESWTQTIFRYNPGVQYRSADGEYDVLHHVFRWTDTNHEDVFRYGFKARDQGQTADNIYYNLDHHVNHGGVPLSQAPRTPHVFVSTTIRNDYYPPRNQEYTYRYEIYAPGGIWVAQTLAHYKYPRQDEVAFVVGIAPRCIRSAQRFRRNSKMRWEPVNNELIINRNFNPQVREIKQPVVDYWAENARRRVTLTEIFYEPPEDRALIMRRRRQVFRSTESNTRYRYASNVANMDTYINAAFRSSRANEAYIFRKNEYALLNYAPGTTNKRVVNGPLRVCDGYPSLVGTAFAEYGIDCAFGSHDKNEAFIFSGNLCACINYAPGTTNDWIIKGPMTIAKMFSFFKGTVFEGGVDAAFESSRRYEAYLFKDDKYALINYSSNGSHLIAIRGISEGFPSLRSTIFERGIDAAFASHRYNEAYIFKGHSYARINFAPGTTNDYIIGSIKPILTNWPSLRGNGMLPHNIVVLMFTFILLYLVLNSTMKNFKN